MSTGTTDGLAHRAGPSFVQGRVLGTSAGLAGAPREVPEVVVAVGDVASCTFLDEDEVTTLALAVGAAPEDDDAPQPRSGTLDAALRYGVDLADLAVRADFRGAAGTVHLVELPRVHDGRGARLPWEGLPLRVVLVGVGQGTVDELRRAGAALAAQVRGDARVLSSVTAHDVGEAVRAFVEGFVLRSYQAPTTRSGRRRERGPAEQLVVLTSAAGEPEARRAVERASETARAAWLARDLVTAPPDLATPAGFARCAERLADDAGLDVMTLDEAGLARHGLGGLLAVGGASENRPRLLVVSSEPLRSEGTGADVAGSASARPHVVLVGQGLTFSTGGLQIRPRTSLPPHKADMAGAAVVLATVWAAARSGRGPRVTAVVPLAENAFDGGAWRPGDVVTLADGTSVETVRTDLDGRLVLADAIAYAVRELAPSALVDVATLTAAASTTFGRTRVPLFASDERVAAVVEAAARRSGERVWRMPFVEDYRDVLGSSVADVRQVPDTEHDVRGAGAVVAALFLDRFRGTVPWVHLDLAGTALASTTVDEVPRGASGSGVRLLLEALDGLGGLAALPEP